MDSPLPSPDRAPNQKTIINLTKPAILNADLTKCRTLGDLVVTLYKRQRDHFFDLKWYDDLVYTAHGINGVDFPLSGPDYDPAIPLPHSFNLSTLRITAEPPPEYNLSLRMMWPVTRDVFEKIQMSVKSHHLISHVKQRIEEMYEVDMSLLEIRNADCQVLADDWNIFECQLYREADLIVRRQAKIVFRINEVEIKISCFFDETLASLLLKFAETMKKDITTLHFVFGATSGPRSEEEDASLTNRHGRFGVDRAVGSVGDNGLQDGDHINVYEQDSKRGREDTDGCDGNRSKKVKVEEEQKGAGTPSQEVD